jgi:hypothetical protein
MSMTTEATELVLVERRARAFAEKRAPVWHGR